MKFHLNCKRCGKAGSYLSMAFPPGYFQTVHDYLRDLRFAGPFSGTPPTYGQAGAYATDKIKDVLAREALKGFSRTVLYTRYAREDLLTSSFGGLQTGLYFYKWTDLKPLRALIVGGIGKVHQQGEASTCLDGINSGEWDRSNPSDPFNVFHFSGNLGCYLPTPGSEDFEDVEKFLDAGRDVVVLLPTPAVSTRTPFFGTCVDRINTFFGNLGASTRVRHNFSVDDVYPNGELRSGFTTRGLEDFLYAHALKVLDPTNWKHTFRHERGGSRFTTYGFGPENPFTTKQALAIGNGVAGFPGFYEAPDPNTPPYTPYVPTLVPYFSGDLGYSFKAFSGLDLLGGLETRSFFDSRLLIDSPIKNHVSYATLARSPNASDGSLETREYWASLGYVLGNPGSGLGGISGYPIRSANRYDIPEHPDTQYVKTPTCVIERVGRGRVIVYHSEDVEAAYNYSLSLMPEISRATAYAPLSISPQAGPDANVPLEDLGVTQSPDPFKRASVSFDYKFLKFNENDYGVRHFNPRNYYTGFMMEAETEEFPPLVLGNNFRSPPGSTPYADPPRDTFVDMDGGFTATTPLKPEGAPEFHPGFSYSICPDTWGIVDTYSPGFTPSLYYYAAKGYPYMPPTDDPMDLVHPGGPQLPADRQAFYDRYILPFVGKTIPPRWDAHFLASISPSSSTDIVDLMREFINRPNRSLVGNSGPLESLELLGLIVNAESPNAYYTNSLGGGGIRGLPLVKAEVRIIQDGKVFRSVKAPKRYFIPNYAEDEGRHEGLYDKSSHSFYLFGDFEDSEGVPLRYSMAESNLFHPFIYVTTGSLPWDSRVTLLLQNPRYEFFRKDRKLLASDYFSDLASASAYYSG